MPKTEQAGLTPSQVQTFIDDGFVKLQNAFSAELAKQCRDELWADIDLSPDEAEDWSRPVIRVASKATPPFIEAANTPLLQGLRPVRRRRALACAQGPWDFPDPLPINGIDR